MIILSNMFRIHLWHHSHHMWTLDFGINLMLIFNSLIRCNIFMILLSLCNHTTWSTTAESGQCTPGLPHQHNRNISLSELSDMWAVKRNRWMTELLIWHVLICGPLIFVGVSVLVLFYISCLCSFLHHTDDFLMVLLSSLCHTTHAIMSLHSNTNTDHFCLPLSVFDPPSGFQYTELYNGFVGMLSYTKHIGQCLCVYVCVYGWPPCK